MGEGAAGVFASKGTRRFSGRGAGERALAAAGCPAREKEEDGKGEERVAAF